MNSARIRMIAFLSIGVLSLGIAACGPEESRTETRSDVSKARTEGQKEVAAEQREAAANRADAQRDVNKTSTELQHETAVGNYEVALARADANHKVAIEQCEAMTGDPRSDCKRQADATRNVAQAQAKSDKLAADPKS